MITVPLNTLLGWVYTLSKGLQSKFDNSSKKQENECWKRWFILSLRVFISETDVWCYTPQIEISRCDITQLKEAGT
jgi:hypothetical protein